MKKDYKKILPKMFHDVSYETDVSDEVKKIAVDQLKKFEGIYIWGPSGTGKTHIVCAICKYVLDEGLDVLFHNTGELLERIRVDYNNNDENGLLLKVMDFKGLLVLDDIGAEKQSDWTRERLYLVLNKRHDEKLPVFLTSNCDLDSLQEQVGDRITSRIHKITVCIEKKGDDYRLN